MSAMIQGSDLVSLFIDGDLNLVANDTGGTSHYFKFGVYAQNSSSYFMESHWKRIEVLKLSGQNERITTTFFKFLGQLLIRYCP